MIKSIQRVHHSKAIVVDVEDSITKQEFDEFIASRGKDMTFEKGSDHDLVFDEDESKSELVRCFVVRRDGVIMFKSFRQMDDERDGLAKVHEDKPVNESQTKVTTNIGSQIPVTTIR